MAYVNFSQHRAYSFGVRPHVSAVDIGLLIRAALAAIAAGVAIVALSGLSVDAGTAASAKGDRLASTARVAETRMIPVSATDGYVNDVGARTTTVVKGVTAPLTPSSPFTDATK